MFGREITDLTQVITGMWCEFDSADDHPENRGHCSGLVTQDHGFLQLRKPDAVQWAGSTHFELGGPVPDNDETAFQINTPTGTPRQVKNLHIYEIDQVPTSKGENMEKETESMKTTDVQNIKLGDRVTLKLNSDPDTTVTVIVDEFHGSTDGHTIGIWPNSLSVFLWLSDSPEDWTVTNVEKPKPHLPDMSDAVLHHTYWFFDQNGNKVEYYKTRPDDDDTWAIDDVDVFDRWMSTAQFEAKYSTVLPLRKAVPEEAE